MDGEAPQFAINCFNAAMHLGLSDELRKTARKLSGVCLMWQGEWAAATGVFSNILGIDGKLVDPEVLAFRGQSLNHLYRLSESVQDLEAALSVWEQGQAARRTDPGASGHGQSENAAVNIVAQRLGVVFAATTHGLASKIYLSLAQPETAVSHANYALQYLISCKRGQETELAAPVYLARALAYAVQHTPGRALADLAALATLAGGVPVVVEQEQEREREQEQGGEQEEEQEQEQELQLQLQQREKLSELDQRARAHDLEREKWGRWAELDRVFAHRAKVRHLNDIAVMA
jgi:hypothetical protein